MKKKVMTAANQSSKEQLPNWLQGLFNNNEEEQTVLASSPVSRVYDCRDDHPLDAYTMAIWREREPEWFDDRLRSQLEDMFRGLDRRMAREVIECLTTYMVWGIRDFTDMWHIDAMLTKAYNKIQHCASQQGIELPTRL